MKDVLIMMLPSLSLIVTLVVMIDLYILIRKYLKLKIEKLKKNNF